MARRKPRFVITVTTTRVVAERAPVRAGRARRSAMTGRRRRSRPAASTAMSRSASPSKRETEVGAVRRPRRRRTARDGCAPHAVVDVRAVGLVADHVHRRRRARANTSAGERARRRRWRSRARASARRGARPSSAPHEMVEVARRDRRRRLDDRARRRRRVRSGAPSAASSASMRGLDVVGELAAARREQLDAVVGERVVRRRDHRRPARRARWHRCATAGVGSTPSSSTSTPSLRHAGRERRFEQVGPTPRVSRPTRQPRRAEHPRRGAAERAGRARGQLGVGDAAHAVGAEAQVMRRRGDRARRQRFEYCGALRAFLRPYFLRLLLAGVTGQEAGPLERRAQSRGRARRARGRCRGAGRRPGPMTPPPSSVASTSYDSSALVDRSGSEATMRCVAIGK